MDIFDQIATGVRPPPPPSARINEALPSLQEQRLRYALAKQVPDMERGFSVATSYGDINIPAGKLATQLRGHMERALARELARQLVRPTAPPAFPDLSHAEAAEICNAVFGVARK